MTFHDPVHDDPVHDPVHTATVQNLELLRNLRTGDAKASLFGTLNHCKVSEASTPFAALPCGLPWPSTDRLLPSAHAHPHCKVSEASLPFRVPSMAFHGLLSLLFRLAVCSAFGPLLTPLPDPGGRALPALVAHPAVDGPRDDLPPPRLRL